MTPWGRRFRLLAGIVIAHAAVNALHGLPHVSVPVPLAPWQELFIAVVILMMPIGGLVFVAEGRIRAGGLAVFLGGTGSAVFGTYFHFFSATPDNVAQVTGPWAGVFYLTAMGISLLAVATAVAGGWLLYDATRTGG